MNGTCLMVWCMYTMHQHQTRTNNLNNFVLSKYFFRVRTLYSINFKAQAINQIKTWDVECFFFLLLVIKTVILSQVYLDKNIDLDWSEIVVLVLAKIDSILKNYSEFLNFLNQKWIEVIFQLFNWFGFIFKEKFN